MVLVLASMCRNMNDISYLWDDGNLEGGMRRGVLGYRCMLSSIAAKKEGIHPVNIFSIVFLGLFYIGLE